MGKSSSHDDISRRLDRIDEKLDKLLAGVGEPGKSKSEPAKRDEPDPPSEVIAFAESQVVTHFEAIAKLDYLRCKGIVNPTFTDEGLDWRSIQWDEFSFEIYSCNYGEPSYDGYIISYDCEKKVATLHKQIDRDTTLNIAQIPWELER